MNRLLTTSVFATAAYALTLLTGQPIANADAASGVVTTRSSAVLSPATEALRDGDDVRARAIATAQFAQFEQSAFIPALSAATAALADGDDIQARAMATVRFEQLQSAATLVITSPTTAALGEADDIRARALTAAVR